MIYSIENIINKTNFNSLIEICKEFNNDEKIDKIDTTKSNFYNRIFVKNDKLNDYYDNLLNFLKDKINESKFQTIDKNKFNSWINKVVSETNKNDKFHTDMSFMTAVTYLNEDFEDGEFEYKDIDGNIIKITPKKGLTLIMDETIFHRVHAVKSGIRYSLVTFFQFSPKEKKTLL
jgi:hypothetical protein